MKDETTRTKTIQAQYYSHMEFNGLNVGWCPVSFPPRQKTKIEARQAIKAHCKKYHQTTKTRQFRIVTVVISTRIEEL